MMYLNRIETVLLSSSTLGLLMNICWWNTLQPLSMSMFLVKYISHELVNLLNYVL